MNAQDWRSQIRIDEEGKISVCDENINTLLRRIVVLEKQLTKEGKEGYTNQDRLVARNSKYEGFGEKLSAPEWARRFNISRHSVWRYLKRGLTPEQIVELRGIEYPKK